MDEGIWVWIFLILLGIEFCPSLTLTIIALAIIYKVYKHHKAKEEAKRAEEEEAAKVREQKLASIRTSIDEELKNLFSQANPDYQRALTLTKSLEPAEARNYAIQRAQNYNSILRRHIIQQSGDGNLRGAAASLNYYCYLNPDDDVASVQKQTVDALIKTCQEQKCYIMSDEYGKPDIQLLKQIDKRSADWCRKSVGKVGVQFFLWFFAIKEPFDENTFNLALANARKIKADENEELIDALMASIYAETNQRKKNSEDVTKQYRDEVLQIVEHTNDPTSLIQLASSLAFSGNKSLEWEALSKAVHSMPEVPEEILKRYNSLKQLIA